MDTNAQDKVDRVIAKYRTRGGAEVWAFTRKTRTSLERPAGHRCQGCERGMHHIDPDTAKRFADKHATECNALPL